MLIDHPPKPNQRILGEHSRGLCNRLRALASAWHVAESYRGKAAIDTVRLLWPKTSGVLAVRFNSLYQNDLVTTRKSSDFVYRNWRLFLTEDEEKKFGLTSIDMIYDQVPKPLQKIYSGHFQRLKPKQAILDNISSFSSHIDDKTIGVHIRTWSEGRRRNIYKFERYHKVITRLMKIHPNSLIYCCADHRKALRKMYTLCGGRLMLYNTKMRSGACNHQLALEELLLLSKCSIIVTNAITSFGEMAWWLGGCKAEVHRVKC